MRSSYNHHCNFGNTNSSKLLLGYNPTTILTNLSFTLDCHLTMNAHVIIIIMNKIFYFEMRRLASIRRCLISTATDTLVSVIVLSKIDYCNSLLLGSTHDVIHDVNISYLK